MTLLKEQNESEHAHAPNVKAAAAEELTQSVKETAAAHLEMVPSQILRSKLAGMSSGLLSQCREYTRG